MLFSCYVTCTKTEMAHDIILLCACVPCKVTAQWSALYPDFTLSLCSVIDCQQGSIYEKRRWGYFEVVWGTEVPCRDPGAEQTLSPRIRCILHF